MFFENVLAFFFELADPALVDSVLLFANICALFAGATLLVLGQLPFMPKFLLTLLAFLETILTNCGGRIDKVQHQVREIWQLFLWIRFASFIFIIFGQNCGFSHWLCHLLLIVTWVYVCHTHLAYLLRRFSWLVWVELEQGSVAWSILRCSIIFLCSLEDVGCVI